MLRVRPARRPRSPEAADPKSIRWVETNADTANNFTLMLMQSPVACLTDCEFGRHVFPLWNPTRFMHPLRGTPNVTRTRPGRTTRRRAGLLRLERAAGCRAPWRGTCAGCRSCVRCNNRSVLADVGANLNRSGGLRDGGLAGGLENQKQQGKDQTHTPR
jgi:hypothetical protein